MATNFEQIICTNLTNTLKPNISRFQGGFVTGRSTVSNLCVISEHASEAIKSKKQFDVIYTDCEKALRSTDCYGNITHYISVS